VHGTTVIDAISVSRQQPRKIRIMRVTDGAPIIGISMAAIGIGLVIRIEVSRREQTIAARPAKTPPS